MSKNHITALLVLLLAVCSCFKDPNFDSGFPGADNGGRNQPERGYSEPTRRVMIMVSAGFNSLSNYLSQDLLDMEQGYLPDGTSYSDDVVLVLSRLPKDYGDYSVECPPVLYRLYKDREKDLVQEAHDNKTFALLLKPYMRLVSNENDNENNETRYGCKNL